MASDDPIVAKIELLDEFTLYLFDLANTIHEHGEMLFRLSDNAKAEADRLRAQLAAQKTQSRAASNRRKG